MRRAALSLLLLAACGGGDDRPDLCDQTPTFNRDIRPAIVEQKCIQCHSVTLTGPLREGAPDGMDFDDYATTKPNIEAFADAITSGRQPPRDLMPSLATTKEERAVASKWRVCDYPE